jgi:hypothetical protein
VSLRRDARFRASASLRELTCWRGFLLVANLLTIVCAICSAFLACKERPEWVWFAGLAVLAGVGGLLALGVVHAQQLASRAQKSAGGQPGRDEFSSGQTLTSTKGGSSAGRLARAAVIAAALA